MNKRISLGVAVSLIAISCAITFVISWAIFKSDISSKITGFEEREKIQSKVGDIDLVVRANYFNEIADENILTNIANGYIIGLNDDGYSSYMTAQDYYIYQMKNQGTVIGAGLEIANENSGYFEVTSVYANSAASANGLQVGDVITEINAKPVKDMNLSSARSLLTGGEGSKVNIKIIRNGEDLIFDLVHQRITITTVYNKLIGQIGYIRFSSFNDTTAEQLKLVLKSLQEEGATNFVFDVRQCSEGELSALTAVLNLLVPPQTIVNGVSAAKSIEVLKTENEDYLQARYAVLVDSGTSYSGEVFAFAMKKGAKAQLIGATTKGMGLQMKVFPFKDSSAVRIPVAKLQIGEESFEKTGIKPDFMVTLPAGLESKIGTLDEVTDTQLAKAISTLTN